MLRYNSKASLFRIADLISFILGGIFVFSGISKCFAFTNFIQTILLFNFTSSFWATNIGVAIIATELALGALLMLGWATRPALSGTLVLGTIFTVALIHALATGKHLECSCFGNVLSGNLETAIVRNVFMICLVIFALRRNAAAKAFFESSKL